MNNYCKQDDRQGTFTYDSRKDKELLEALSMTFTETESNLIHRLGYHQVVLPIFLINKIIRSFMPITFLLLAQ